MLFTGGFQPKPIAFKVSNSVQAAISELGRTEDLHFSPDHTRLAIAGFRKDCLLVINLAFKNAGKSKAASSNSALLVSSPGLNYPHGLFWLGHDRLIVANRGGNVGLFELPPAQAGVQTVQLSPVAEITKRDFRALNSPGSVSVFQRSTDEAEVLICNNFGGTVSRHTLTLKGPPRFRNHKVLLQSGLNVPDGVNHDPSGRFIAVSNHSARCIDLHDISAKLGRTSKPFATLSGFGYPHGVRFSKDGKLLFVADAAEPFVHVFQRGAGGWRDAEPAAAVQVMPEDAYLRGHANAEEGGPKGIVLWEDAGLLAVTCEETPICFFDISAILAAPEELPAAMLRTRVAAGPLPIPAPRRGPGAGLWYRFLQTVGL